MELRFIFWFIYLLSFLISGWFFWPAGGGPGFAPYGPLGSSWLAYILIGILGWKVFGKAVIA